MNAGNRRGFIVLRTHNVPPDTPQPLANETPWYNGDQLPRQIGVYKRLSVAGVVMHSLFDGAHWLWMHRSADMAVRAPSTDVSLCQTLPWCGLRAPAPQGYGLIPTPPVLLRTTGADQDVL